MAANSILKALILTLAFGAGLMRPDIATAQQSNSIRIGWLPDPNVGLYLAREKKLFEKAGLQPEYIKFLSGPATFAALQSKSVDVAEFGMPPSIIAKSQGIDIKVVAVSVDVSNTDVLVAQNDLKISSPSDLKGKRVTTVRGSSDYFGLTQYLKSGGLDIKDIQFLDISAQNIVPAFRGKEVDAAWIWSPWQNMLLSLGGKRVTSNAEGGVLVPNVWVVRTEWAKNNPEALQKFLKAVDAGLQQVRLDKDLAISQVSATLNVDQTVAGQILRDARYPDLATQYSSSDPLSLVGGATGDGGLKAAMKRVNEFLLSAGIIPAPVNIDELLDPEPVSRYTRTQ